MSKALWAGGALSALALLFLHKRRAVPVPALGGLQQLEQLEPSSGAVVASRPVSGTWDALSEAELIRRLMNVDPAVGVLFGKPLPRAIVGGGWGDARPSRVGTYHYAIDLAAATGTPIFASTSGTVVWADARGSTTAGKYVVVKQGGVSTRYLHMSAVHVARGDRVELGQVLGLVGSTGFSSGPHLHLDVFVSDSLLVAYRDQYGTPDPGYPKRRRWGTQVPAETLIPVDGYSGRVMAAARKRGVRLLTQPALS